MLPTCFHAGFLSLLAISAPSESDVGQLSAAAPSVRVELEHAVIVAIRQNADLTDGGFTWTGVLAPPHVGFASFAVVDGVVAGTVREGQNVARVHGRLGGRVEVATVDAASLAPCTEPEVDRFVSSAPQLAPLSIALATAATIDVMVVWTPLARATEGGAAAVEALIDLALAETNSAYAESGVLQRVRLAARHEVAYSESPSVVTDLARMTIANDGFLDQIPALRDACGADVVAMIVESGQSCGVANSLTNLGAGFAPYAFCVVARNCAAANLSLAHELGHVMGLAHDRDTSTTKCSRVSVAGNSTQVVGASGQPSIARNGSFVAFASSASTLVTGDTNGAVDIFLRNRGLLATTRVSVSSAGLQANGASIGAPSTGDGAFVAFASTATNLVAGDTNGAIDVFVRDVGGSTTTRILAAGGAEADGDCFEPSFSTAERWVVFTTRAPNLGASLANSQILRWDRLSGATVLVSASVTSQPALGVSSGARVSEDGRFVAFSSAASDLVANDTNGAIDVFVRDMTLATTSRASLSTLGFEIAGPCEPLCAISADGRFVAFASASADVVGGDTNGVTDLFARDRVGNVTLLASQNLLGSPANGATTVGSAPSFSSDGRRLAFTSRADDLVANDANSESDVFVRDLISSSTERVSISSSGAEIPGGAGEGSAVAIDSTGMRVAFASRAACSSIRTASRTSTCSIAANRIHRATRATPTAIERRARRGEPSWRTPRARASRSSRTPVCRGKEKCSASPARARSPPKPGAR